MVISVVGAGIARTVFLVRTVKAIDKYWEVFPLLIASITECNIAIVCACAPSVKAVARRFFSNKDSSENSSISATMKKWSQSLSLRSAKGVTTMTAPELKSGHTSGPVDHTRRSFETASEATLVQTSSFVQIHEYGLQDKGSITQGYG
jgi:hypothetical protein